MVRDHARTMHEAGRLGPAEKMLNCLSLCGCRAGGARADPAKPESLGQNAIAGTTQ